MDTYAHSREGTGYEPGVKVCKEGDYTNSTYFHMYLGAKYMRLPVFLENPKNVQPFGHIELGPNGFNMRVIGAHPHQ